MNCPRCSAKTDFSKDDIRFLNEKFSMIICPCCGRPASGLAWLWGFGWFDQPSIQARFNRIIQFSREDESLPRDAQKGRVRSCFELKTPILSGGGGDVEV